MASESHAGEELDPAPSPESQAQCYRACLDWLLKSDPGQLIVGAVLSRLPGVREEAWAEEAGSRRGCWPEPQKLVFSLKK